MRQERLRGRRHPPPRARTRPREPGLERIYIRVLAQKRPNEAARLAAALPKRIRDPRKNIAGQCPVALSASSGSSGPDSSGPLFPAPLRAPPSPGLTLLQGGTLQNPPLDRVGRVFMRDGRKKVKERKKERSSRVISGERACAWAPELARGDLPPLRARTAEG